MFHLAKKLLMKRYHAIVHGLCPNFLKREGGKERGISGNGKKIAVVHDFYPCARRYLEKK